MRLIRHPVLCNYYVTYRCNASCSFCDIWEKPSPYVSVENAEQNFRSLRKLGVKIIDFTGGEPLLHREIDLLLRKAKDYNFITTLTTNTLLYPKWSEKLKGRVDMLHFSLDSAYKEEHDRSRGVSCFESVLNSIQIARKIGERPDILFTVFENNIDQIEEVYTKIVIPNNLVLILNPVFTYNNVDTCGGLSENALRKLSSWGDRKNIFFNKAFLKLRQEGGNHIDSPVCRAASTTIVISPENKLVLPCYHLGIKEFQINNDLESLYYRDEVQKLVRMEGRFAECEGCVINCYMQPSFSVYVDRFFWSSLPSTFKYNRMKGTWKRLLAKP